jgi:hypothetical protein
MTTTSNLEAYFESYAAASLSGDPTRIAAYYAPTFIVGGPKGSAAFPNDDKFLEWLKGVADFNRQAGMEAMQVVDVHAHELNELHTVATVTWGARFRKTGDQLIEFKITYTLEGNDNERKILSYIAHTDQEDEMKRLDLLP